MYIIRYSIYYNLIFYILIEVRNIVQNNNTLNVLEKLCKSFQTYISQVSYPNFYQWKVQNFANSRNIIIYY